MRNKRRWRGTPALMVTVLVAGMLGAIGLAASPASAQKALTVTTASLPAAPEGNVYSVKLAAADGVKPYTWSIVNGALPAGLTLVPATGLIQGIAPIGVPADDQFTVQVSDSENPAVTATANLSIQVQIPPPLQLTMTVLPAAAADVHYSQKLDATGGAQPYTWSITDGALPAGLTLQPTTGVISGSPTVGGNFRFTAQVSSPTETKTGPGTTTASAIFSMTVDVAALSITTDGDSLPAATAGVPYSVKLEAVGGLTPYTWSITDGTLPPGLKLHPATGVISGTPTAGGPYAFTATVTDSESTPQTQSLSGSITVASSLAIVTTDLPGGIAGESYSAQLTASGGRSPYTWSLIDGSQLPAGLSLSPDGSITGIPAGGTTSFTVQVTDSETPAITATADLSIAIGYDVEG